MKTGKCLWYDLLTKGKKELGWKYGLSIPFLVGTYTRKRKANFGSLSGIKEIFEEIKATIGDEEIGIVKCGKFTTMDVFTIQVLSDIPSVQARITRENTMAGPNIYTTIEDVNTLDLLCEKLWDMYKEPITKGHFSAHNKLRGDEWLPFNEQEEDMIANL